MSVTRANLRARTVEVAFGDHYTFTTTSSVDNVSVISTDLLNFIEGNDTNGFENWFVLLTSGNNDTEERMCSDSTNTTGDMTVSQAYTNTVASSVTGEILPWPSRLIHSCIDAAGRQVRPFIYLPVLDENEVTNGLGANMNFEGTFASGVPNGWTEDDAGTQTTEQETTRVLHGSNSVSLAVSSGSTDRGIYQDLTVNQGQIAGHSITLGGFIWSTTADSGWLRLDFGASHSSNTNSPKSLGQEEWEHIVVSSSIPTDASRLRIHCQVESTGTPVAYFDQLYCYIKPIYRYSVPSAFDAWPSSISIQNDRQYPVGDYSPLDNWWTETSGETRYIQFGDTLPSGYRLKMKGSATLTLPSTDATSMEITNAQQDVIANYAAAELKRRLASGGGMDTDVLEKEAQRHERRAEYLLRQPGVVMPTPTTLRMPSKVI